MRTCSGAPNMTMLAPIEPHQAEESEWSASQLANSGKCKRCNAAIQRDRRLRKKTGEVFGDLDEIATVWNGTCIEVDVTVPQPKALRLDHNDGRPRWGDWGTQLAQVVYGLHRGPYDRSTHELAHLCRNPTCWKLVHLKAMTFEEHRIYDSPDYDPQKEFDQKEYEEYP